MEKAETHFERYRERLFGIAYRMTGMVADSEDLVQEAFVKWIQADAQTILNPEAWLVRVINHLALDHLKSASQQRRTYPGPWLPEPLVHENEGPEGQLGLDESLSIALLVVLERLTPHERAAFILHEIFQYPYEEVAAVLEKTNSHCRQLASRARKKIQPQDPRGLAPLKTYHRMIPAFVDAIKGGDASVLESLLRADVVFHADGGGKATAARKPIYGVEKVSRFLLRVLTPLWVNQKSKPEFREVWFNGSPGLLLQVGNRIETAFQFHLEKDRIHSIFGVRNPEKLTGFSCSKSLGCD